MASITSSGLGSGLDVTSIISQLMTIEKQPLIALNKEESSINAKISSFGKIQNAPGQLEGQGGSVQFDRALGPHHHDPDRCVGGHRDVAQWAERRRRLAHAPGRCPGRVADGEQRGVLLQHRTAVGGHP